MDDRKVTKLDRFLDLLDRSISGEDILVFAVLMLILVAIFFF